MEEAYQGRGHTSDAQKKGSPRGRKKVAEAQISSGVRAPILQSGALGGTFQSVVPVSTLLWG